MCALQLYKPGHGHFMQLKIFQLHTNSCVRGSHPRPVTLMENSESTRPHRGVPLPMGSPALWLVTSPAAAKPFRLFGAQCQLVTHALKICVCMGACRFRSMS